MSHAAYHSFLFCPGKWLGQGKISFTHSPDVLSFYTSWHIQKRGDEKFVCTQKVEIIGGEEMTINTYTIQEIGEKGFVITLENPNVGSIQGEGSIDVATIFWEFSLPSIMEGREFYDRQEQGEYLFRGEYRTSGQYRSKIEGKIWQKEKSSDI